MIDNYKKLVKKYNESGPRYTSYPPATFFSRVTEIKIILRVLNYQIQRNQKIYQFMYMFRFVLKSVIFVAVQLKQVSHVLSWKDM